MVYVKRKTRAEREAEILESLEAFDDFMEMARKIANLMKDIGSVPTPRQLKIHLDIDARKMRAVCKGFKIDPYEVVIKEARRVLLKNDGLAMSSDGLHKVVDV